MTGNKSNRFSWVPGDDHAIHYTSHPTSHQPRVSFRHQDSSSGVQQETSGDALSIISQDEFFFHARAYSPPFQYERDTNTQPSHHKFVDNTKILPSPLHIKKLGAQCAVEPHHQQLRQPDARFAAQPCPQRSLESLLQKTIRNQLEHLEPLYHEHTASDQHSATPGTQPLPNPRQKQEPISQQPEQSRPQCTEKTRPQRAEEMHIQRTGNARSDQPPLQIIQKPRLQSAKSQSTCPLVEHPHPRGNKQSQIPPTEQSQVSTPEKPRTQQLPSHFRAQPTAHPHPSSTQQQQHHHHHQQPHPHPQPISSPPSLHPLTPYTRTEQKSWINSVNTQTSLSPSQLLAASTLAAKRKSYHHHRHQACNNPSSSSPHRPQLLRKSSSMSALHCDDDDDNDNEATATATRRPCTKTIIAANFKGMGRWLREPVGSGSGYSMPWSRA